VDKLPHAMAILTIVGNLVYSLEPVIVDIIDYLGAPATFIVGGVAVFLSGYALKKNSLGLFKLTDNKEAAGSVQSKIKRSQYLLIFFPGLVVGVTTTILFNVFPAVFETRLAAVFHTDGKVMLVAVLLLSAIMSWPLSYAVNKYGMLRIFWLSFIVVAFSAMGILFNFSTISLLAASLVFTLAYTALSVSALPLAINRSGFSEKVFCVGLFFSGVALPEAILEAYLAYGV
jgi:hypothetical protein